MIAAGIVTYVKAKAEQLKLTSAVIPGLDYVKVFVDTIMTLSIMSETPQLSEKQDTILKKCLPAKTIINQTAELEATKSLLPVKDLKPWADYLFAFSNQNLLSGHANLIKMEDYPVGFRVIRRVCCARVDFFLKL